MKVSNTTTKLLAILIALGALAVVWSVWSTGRASAAGGGVWKTGMFGIARGQTFQLNCLNLGSEPIQVQFRILDGDGNPLAIMPCEAPPGQSVSPSLNRDDIGREGNRIEIRAEETTSHERNQRNQVITGEVFNNSDGRTTFTIPPVPRFPGD